MKLKFDWPVFIAAVRTAGSLMVGNVFVSALLFNNRNWLYLAGLLGLGLLAIISTSFTRKE